VSANFTGTNTVYTQGLGGCMSQILASTSGSVLADYLRDDGGSLLASLTGGTRTWYGTDNQGSVRQTLDDSANVLATQSYDPYGTPESSSNVGIFGYTGELQTGSSSAEYLRARWYQPGTGTLLGVDPELTTTDQTYAYAGDDPVDASDPGGTCATAHNGDLPGIEGSGACDTAIEDAFTGRAMSVSTNVQTQLPALDQVLNDELDDAALGVHAEHSFIESEIVDPAACPTVNVCAEDL
jgi:RHS repeat-associated protein